MQRLLGLTLGLMALLLVLGQWVYQDQRRLEAQARKELQATAYRAVEMSRGGQFSAR